MNKELLERYINEDLMMITSEEFNTLVTSEEFNALVIDATLETFSGGEEDEYREVFQWYRTTKGFANLLKDKGGIVFEWEGNYIWGRTTCGQAIIDDGVMQALLEE